MKPCRAFAGNSHWRQLWHVFGELLEVAVELWKGNRERAAEGLADVQVSCETLLWRMGYTQQHERNHIRNLVDEKNRVRGYHETRF